MLRQLTHGFAKRVDDTGARTMAILQRWQDHISQPEDCPLSGSNSSRKDT
jgi:hypothetical protein